MQFSRNWHHHFGLLGLTFFLMACSASQRVVKTYEGAALPEDQLARLEVREDIKVVKIDGVQQKTYLLDNLALTYSLLPGEHTIVYQYSSIWARAGGSIDSIDVNQSKVDLVNSQLRQVRMVFKPGKTYYFSFQEPTDKREAGQLAKDFSAVIVDENGLTVAVDSSFSTNRMIADSPPASSANALAVGGTVKPPGVQSPVTAAGESAPLPAKAVGAVVSRESNPGSEPVQSIAPVNAGLSRLDAIKVLWTRASADEKKEFLRWAFQ